VRDRFFAPVDLALAEVDEGRRKCPSVSDRDHIISGISRLRCDGLRDGLRDGTQARSAVRTAAVAAGY